MKEREAIIQQTFGENGTDGHNTKRRTLGETDGIIYSFHHTFTFCKTIGKRLKSNGCVEKRCATTVILGSCVRAQGCLILLRLRISASFEHDHTWICFLYSPGCGGCQSALNFQPYVSALCLSPSALLACNRRSVWETSTRDIIDPVQATL